MSTILPQNTSSSTDFVPDIQIVTFEDIDDELDSDDDELEVSRTSSNIVQVLDRYGPKQLSGEQRIMPVKKTYHATPHVDVLGNGAGGLGVDIEKTRIYASRWTFRGDLMPGKDKRRKGVRGTVYKSIKWELSENDIETQTVHSNVIHTGFAFQHEGKPCYLRVEIDGKLYRTRDRIKNKFKFPPEHRKEQGSTLTLIDLSRSEEYNQRLDHIANGLSRAMELENYTEIPMEVPDALPASFQDAAPVNNSNQVPVNFQNSPSTTFIENTPLNRPHQTPGRITSADSQPSLDSLVNTSDPLVASLARALDPVHLPESQQHIHEYVTWGHSAAPSVQSSTTLVGDNPMREEVIDPSKDVRRKEEAEAVQEALLRISQSPALLLLFQFLANFLNLFGKTANSGKELIDQ